MKNRLEIKKALEIAKKTVDECLNLLEKTAFLFHSYKENIVIDRTYIEHLKAMSRKVVEAFDNKSEQIQDFVVVYEAIKALMVAINEATKKQNNNGLVF